MVKPRRHQNWLKGVRHPLLRRAGITKGMLVAMTDEARMPDPAALARQLPPGTIFIYRHYDHPRREQIAKDLRRITRKRGQIMLVAGDAMLARRVGADGLHLGRRALFSNQNSPVPTISAACHDVKAVRRAKTLGVALALVSPIFATRSHPGAQPKGFYRMINMTAWHQIACVMLGGVDMKTAGCFRSVGRARKPAGLAAIDGLTHLNK